MKPLMVGMTRSDRRTWHKQALDALASADLVFVDPDNGTKVGKWSSNHQKFAFTDELADYTARAQTLIVYHHADRSPGGVPVQVQRRMAELHTATRIEPLGAVVARRGSCRFFLILPTNEHRGRLSEVLPSYAARWLPHTEFHPYQGESVNPS